MKILNSIANKVYDTTDHGYSEVFKGEKPKATKALHQNHCISDHEFLRKWFPESHPVFYAFSNTFYYMISESE